MTTTQIRAARENRSGIAEIARQLEAVRIGRGFFNVARLKAAGLIETRKTWVHTQTYNVRTDETEFRLTAKGSAMLSAANRVLITV